MMLADLRRSVCELNQELPRQGLAAWTTGNLSARDPDSGLVAIKPSGVRYEQMTPESVVVLDLDGRVVQGDLQPSVDTASHIYIYQHRPDVNGVVHTHSTYATAFAAVGRSIPVYLTSLADHFGGPIPVGEYAAPIGGEGIGAAILASIGSSSAILMKNHGVFTLGPDAGSALQTAVMVEQNAKTVAIAFTLGEPDLIPIEDVTQQREFYKGQYGQRRGGSPSIIRR